MFNGKRQATAAMAIAVGFLVAPGAQAAWFGFGSRPATPPAVTLAQAGGDAERVNQLETQVRNLTGQVETLQHQLEQLQTQLQAMQADNEFRFSELSGKGSGQAPAPAPQSNPAPLGAAVAAEAPLPPQQQQQQPVLGAPPKSLGTLTITGGQAPQAGQQPLDLSALARGDAGAPNAPAAVDQTQIVAAPSGDPQNDYKAAYELFLAGQYAPAETAFRQFLDAYPGDPRAADATYWLGQSLFSRGMYRDAALEFVNSHKLYPKSARAADTMLLLGKSLAGIPEQQAACQTFAAALKQYPQMSNALRQRVITEQANAGC